MIRTPRQRLPLILGLFILILGILAGMFFGLNRYAREFPGGGNFSAYWVATRGLIDDALSPYSAETAGRIQAAIEDHDIPSREQMRSYPHPLFAMIFSAPFAMIDDYELARAGWALLNLLCLGGTIWCVLRFSDWQAPWWQVILIILFAVFWLHGQQALKSGNAVFLSTFLLAGALLALKNGAEELAGVLLAFSLIRPNVALPGVVYLVVWAIMNRRGRMFLWLVIAASFLFASAALLFPDWLVQELRTVVEFPQLHYPGTPGGVLARLWPVFGQRVGFALSAVCALLILAEWRVVLRSGEQGLAWGLWLTLTVGQWLGIYTSPDNFVVLVPAILFSLSLLAKRWQRGAAGFVPVVLLVLYVLPWMIYRAMDGRTTEEIREGLMFFPIPLLVFFLLIWVRWWAVEKSQPWLDQINL